MSNTWACAALIVATLSSGCNGCGDKTVPFGLKPEPRPVEPVSVDPDVGVTFEPGRTQIPVEQHSYSLDNGHIRTHLSPFVITEDGQQVSVRKLTTSDTAVHASTLTQWPIPPACAVKEASLRHLADDITEASLSVTCPEARVTQNWFLSRQAPFVVIAQVSQGPDNAPLFTNASAQDRDGDGHNELEVTFSASEDGPGAPVVWLNRPAGMLIDASQPLASLSTMADQPDIATSLFFALCTEGHAPAVRIDQTAGVKCGDPQPLATVGAAAVTRLIDAGEPAKAHRLQSRLQRAGIQLPGALRAAWNRSTSPTPVKISTIVERADVGPLWFVDAHHVFVGGALAKMYDVRTGEVTEPTTHPAITDPSGRYVAVGLNRNCRGYVAHVRGSDGKTRSVSLRKDVQVAPCNRSIAGWELLGWAPQGLLVSAEDQLLVVPLDVHANPAGEPSVLSPGALPPAPITGPAITRDGRHMLITTPHGLIARTLGPGGGDVWLAPKPWSTAPQTIVSKAIGPDAKSAAVQRGGQVYLLRW